MSGKNGKNKPNCLRYRTEGRREKNKIRKINKHLKKYPNDTQSKQALKRLL